MDPKRADSNLDALLMKLGRSITPVLIYNITFLCINEPLTRSTVELEHEHVDQLVDEEATRQLRETKSINWCRTTVKLNVLKNGSRGRRSFLQAVSKLLWDVSDSNTETFLQQLMDANLCSARESARFKERWETETGSHRSKELPPAQYSWEEICKAFQDVNGTWDESSCDVDRIHVFTMSNVLKRPILLVGESIDTTTTESLEGLYLPVLLKSEDCPKCPLVLSCLNQRFKPIVVQPEDQCCLQPIMTVPLVTDHLEQLPLRCLSDEERQKRGFHLIQAYLNVEEISYTGPYAINQVLAARLTSTKPDRSLASFETTLSSAPETIRNKQVSLEPSKNTTRLYFDEKQGIYDNSSALILEYGLRCSQPQCNQLVDPENFPKCTRHAIKNQDLSKAERTSSKSSARSCIMRFCSGEGQEEYRGKCRVCYVRGNDDFYEQPSEPNFSHSLTEEANILEPKAVGNVRNSTHSVTVGTANHGLANETRYERQMSEQLKCIIAHCENVGLSTYKGICVQCFNTICQSQIEKENTIYQPKVQKQDASYTESVTRSGTRIVTSQMKCLNEGCHSAADDEELGLCRSCYEQQRQAQKAVFDSKNRSKGNSQLSGSTSSEPQQSIIPADHSHHQPLPPVHNQRHARNSTRLQETPQRAKMCLNNACDRYGDPGFNGFCSVCFVRQIK